MLLLVDLLDGVGVSDVSSVGSSVVVAVVVGNTLHVSL